MDNTQPTVRSQASPWSRLFAPTSVALVGASVGLSVIDPTAALLVAAIAATASVELWRGEQDDCCAPVGFVDPARGDCCSTGGDCRG